MFIFIVITVLNIVGTGCQSENVTISIDKSEVMLGDKVTLTCTYYGNRTESGILWFNGSDTTGLLYLPGCTKVSTPSSFYDTGRILPTCNSSSNVYTLTITVNAYDFGSEWCCSFILTPNVRCGSNTKITVLTTTTTTSTNKTKCELELGCGLGIGFSIPCVITSIAIGISMYKSQSKVSDGTCKPEATDGKRKPKETDGKRKPKETDFKRKPKETGYKLAYFLGLVHGVTFQVGWIIIASLICTGTTSCKLELGLGLGIGSGMPCVITIIIAVILFSSEDNHNRVEKGKGMLTGLFSASVIGIIVVYLKYDKLKPEQTVENLELTVTISKTTNSGPHKVEQNTISEQTNYRQQPLPPMDTEFENTPYRPLPQPPQNGEIKDRNLRGISATIDDTPGLANETPGNKLPPLTIEPKKRRKKRQKKDQMNEETPEEETALRVN